MDDAHRLALCDLLAHHVPDPGKTEEAQKERADLERMRAYAQMLAAPFSRQQSEAHFTGSAVVVDPEGARVCLVHHRKLLRWLQPGGHADSTDGGRMQATALREAREETGLMVELHPALRIALDVDIHRIPARKDEPEHAHLDVRFLMRANDPENLAHDPGESFGARWLPWDEALKVADEPAMRRLLRKARRIVEAITSSIDSPS